MPADVKSTTSPSTTPISSVALVSLAHTAANGNAHATPVPNGAALGDGKVVVSNTQLTGKSDEEKTAKIKKDFTTLVDKTPVWNAKIIKEIVIPILENLEIELDLTVLSKDISSKILKDKGLQFQLDYCDALRKMHLAKKVDSELVQFIRDYKYINKAQHMQKEREFADLLSKYLQFLNEANVLFSKAGDIYRRNNFLVFIKKEEEKAFLIKNEFDTIVSTKKIHAIFESDDEKPQHGDIEQKDLLRSLLDVRADNPCAILCAVIKIIGSKYLALEFNGKYKDTAKEFIDTKSEVDEKDSQIKYNEYLRLMSILENSKQRVVHIRKRSSLAEMAVDTVTAKLQGSKSLPEEVETILRAANVVKVRLLQQNLNQLFQEVRQLRDDDVKGTLFKGRVDPILKQSFDAMLNVFRAAEKNAEKPIEYLSAEKFLDTPEIFEKEVFQKIDILTDHIECLRVAKNNFIQLNDDNFTALKTTLAEYESVSADQKDEKIAKLAVLRQTVKVLLQQYKDLNIDTRAHTAKIIVSLGQSLTKVADIKAIDAENITRIEALCHTCHDLVLSLQPMLDEEAKRKKIIAKVFILDKAQDCDVKAAAIKLKKSADLLLLGKTFGKENSNRAVKPFIYACDILHAEISQYVRQFQAKPTWCAIFGELLKLDGVKEIEATKKRASVSQSPRSQAQLMANVGMHAYSDAADSKLCGSGPGPDKLKDLEEKSKDYVARISDLYRRLDRQNEDDNKNNYETLLKQIDALCSELEPEYGKEHEILIAAQALLGSVEGATHALNERYPRLKDLVERKIELLKKHPQGTFKSLVFIEILDRNAQQQKENVVNEEGVKHALHKLSLI